MEFEQRSRLEYDNPSNDVLQRNEALYTGYCVRNYSSEYHDRCAYNFYASTVHHVNFPINLVAITISLHLTPVLIYIFSSQSYLLHRSKLQSK
jgi:hypothetical protein